MIRCAILLLTLAVLSADAAAGPAAAKKGDALEEVLELSGFNDALRQLPDHITSQMSQHEAKDPEGARKVAAAMRDGFSFDRLHKIVLDYFRQNLDRNQVAAILDFLRSPLALKLTRLEEEASSVQGVKQMQEWAATTLKSNPPSQARLAILARLDRSTGASEVMLKLGTGAARATMQVLSETLPAARRLTQAQIEQHVAQMEAQSRSQLVEYVALSFLFAYRTVSDAELEEYIQFYDSPAGKALTKVVGDALVAATAGGCAAAMKQLASSAGR